MRARSIWVVQELRYLRKEAPNKVDIKPKLFIESSAAKQSNDSYKIRQEVCHDLSIPALVNFDKLSDQVYQILAELWGLQDIG
jgi:hypothetical protein